MNARTWMVGIAIAMVAACSHIERPNLPCRNRYPGKDGDRLEMGIGAFHENRSLVSDPRLSEVANPADLQCGTSGVRAERTSGIRCSVQPIFGVFIAPTSVAASALPGGIFMSTAKEELTRLIESQPADASREEIVRELAFHLMVERGLADSDANRVVSNDEMAHRIRTWRK